MDQKKIGMFIASCRKEKGFTQTQLGEKLGVTCKAVSKWECGKNLPDPSLYKPLCSLLGINLIELFEGERIAEQNTIQKADALITTLAKESKQKAVYEKLMLLITSLFLIAGVVLIFLSAAKALSQNASVLCITAGLSFLFIGMLLRVLLWAKRHNRVIKNEGMGFCSALTLAFIVLKLTDTISWPWIWVLFPLWGSVTGIALLLLIIFVIGKAKKKW